MLPAKPQCSFTRITLNPKTLPSRQTTIVVCSILSFETVYYHETDLIISCCTINRILSFN
jgi:hypothetical protein